jgi:MYXO-CTERM domain-containing protein
MSSTLVSIGGVLVRCSLVVFLLLTGVAARADVTETFNQATPASDGTKLGACKQLTAHVYEGGSVNISGNGAAVVKSPAATDAAFLASSDPLPSSGYKVSVRLSNIGFLQSFSENGVTLLSIVNTAPQPMTEMGWRPLRVLAIEVDILPAPSDAHPIYVNYWDLTNMYTWSGAAWGMGDQMWKPCLAFDPAKSYTVEIEKTATTYTLRVLSDTGAKLTEAAVPVKDVLPSTTEYFVVGDRLTSDFSGSMDINSVSMPTPAGCTAQLDGGPTADRKLTSWDLYSPEAGRRNPPSDSGCACAVHQGPRPAGPLAGLLVLLLGLALSRRR